MLPEEDQLVSTIKEFVNQERALESAKTSLTLKADFNLTDAFHIFDPHHRGTIDVHDLRTGLSAIGVHPTSDELELFMTRYDTNKNGRLDFHEFSAAFTPLDSYHAHMLQRRASNHRAPVYRRDDCFFADTQQQQRSVWNTHFQTENAAE